jgi:phosphate-selective porin OprO/OprP
MAGTSKFDASDITSTSAGLKLASSTGNTNEATSYRIGLKFIPDPNTRILLSYVDTDFEGENKSIVKSGATISDERAINLRMQYDF